MLLYLLPLAVLGVVLALFAVVAAALFRAVVALIRIRERHFSVDPAVARPGEILSVQARVVPRGQAGLIVCATLTCMMFDHRTHQLYTTTVQLDRKSDQPDVYTGSLRIPAYALRTGIAGHELSKLFSEEVHRVLVFWSVVFEVSPAKYPDRPILRVSVPVEIPDGKALHADRAYMEQLIIDTCGAMHSDLVLNWMVRLAASNGIITPAERTFLHQVVRVSHATTDPDAADALIDRELQQTMELDPAVLRKHLPSEMRADFYRFLYAMAWRDGSLDGREHTFLVQALDKLGLDRRTIVQIESEVLCASARAQLA